MEEVWKDIEGYEGLYQVSNQGRVKSLLNMWGKGERILKAREGNGGYCYVNLYRDKRYKSYKVHRLVYRAFCGDIPADMQVNHINEDKADNRLVNLNLLSCKDNLNWGTRNNRIAEKSCKPIEQYDKAGTYIKTYPSAKEAASDLGISRGGICSCCKGQLKTAGGFVWRYAETA